MIIFDEVGHLMSTDIDPTELHDFAFTIGLKREWFQEKTDPPQPWYDHYDLTTERMKRKADRAGAFPATMKTIVDNIAQKRKRIKEQWELDTIERNVNELP